MILSLATRFQKSIAVLLLSIFYGEGVLAAGLYPDSHYIAAYTSGRVREKRFPVFGYPQKSFGYEPDKGVTIIRPVPVNLSSLHLPAPPALSIDKRMTASPFSEQAGSIKKAITSKNRMARPPIGGPTQPEMSAFQSVNNTNMVDLFSGDFSYNIPLMDVGGYPLNIAYRSGISMDQEASWVGLGWNINPGTITRNMRGLPDDFNGAADTIKKTTHVKENKTIGVTGGMGAELIGLPMDLSATLGVFHNNYKGWGLENGLNVSINAGANASGSLTGGLSLTNNSQEGLTISPSLGCSFTVYESSANGATSAGLSIGSSYNSRSGLKSLQLTPGIRQSLSDTKNQVLSTLASNLIPTGNISFASPSFTPTITMPFTSNQYSFKAKLGGAITGLHPYVSIAGYVSKQRIDVKDTTLVLPSYGYLNYQGANNNRSALLDFNREKEIPYREKPAIPNIAIPNYTYDVFSITGEGSGGMFRAYRGDIGFVYDHAIQTKDESDRASIDLGQGTISHVGADLDENHATTRNGPWLSENLLKNSIAFQSSHGTFEAAYFRNPGEMAINSKNFYNAIGDDDVVAANLYQGGRGSSMFATSLLNRYHNKNKVGELALTADLAVKKQRDKRTQVITYLTAQEASTAGLEKYINNYSLNTFSLQNCHNFITDNTSGKGTGLTGKFYRDTLFTSFLFQRTDTTINFPSATSFNVYDGKQLLDVNFAICWTGRIQAPVTGTYSIATSDDDGVRLWLNDTLLIDNWILTPAISPANKDTSVNLVAGQFYSIKLKYYQGPEKKVRHLFSRKREAIASLKLLWSYGGKPLSVIPKSCLYPLPAPDADTLSNLILERRTNQYRKPNHLSEIDVLNADGRRYVYGIPAYNFKQKEATFSVDYHKGNTATGLTGYTDGVDNTASRNTNGKDNYYSCEEIPSYAHSFLLTGILSPDYVDLTGDGITDDDPGDAIHFKYTKIGSYTQPYGWRAPYIKDSVTYNEGLKTDNRDDKGSYVYGEKELWYLNSVESKNMMATFTVENRLDLGGISESGARTADHYAKRLKQIDLYNKADFLKNGTNARPVKTVHFEYSYELCKGVNQPLSDSSGKLTLKKIWFTYNGNDKGKLNPYIFTYHANNPSYNVNAYDKWGNYKHPLQNPGSTTTNLVTNGDYPYSVQDSVTAAYNAGAWTLTQVKLPSGGVIKVDYESDDYAYVQNKRAGQMFRLAGLAASPDAANLSDFMYLRNTDNIYAFVDVASVPASVSEVYSKYLEGITKLYFKLAVKMPADKYGGGIEYVPCYAGIESYGFVPGTNRIWIKLKGTGQSGEADGPYSPLAEAAIQFLRLNLPSKAYPGSEVGDNLDLMDAVKIIASMAGNIVNAFSSFHNIARGQSWGCEADLNRTLVRLDNPDYKKLGGGLRVKRLVTYDNWNAMTHQQESVYGRTYDYTTVKEINGSPVRISSGVASYEPMIGGDENPFRIPIEYQEQIAPFAPTNMGYTEEPLGESFFPSASVGYSKVTVRSVNTNNVKSANGYEETRFYTTYDFPTITDRSLLDDDSKKRYKPTLANFLRIDASYYLMVSQGFKVELNDMNGKIRSQATYPETDANNPISYTENFYNVDDQAAEFKHLSNTVKTMDPSGRIDTASIIGKDIELMTDMREQETVSIGNNHEINGDFFTIGIFPVILASFLTLGQKEDNRFRSAAISKVIQRHGILDSVIHIEKGSKISTRNLLYDSETGDVLLSRTQNEFNDPVYNFNYPAHWAYDGMGEAYKNINTVFDHVFMKGGKIVAGLPSADSNWFVGGDELLINSKVKTGSGSTACNESFATFAAPVLLWALDTTLGRNGVKGIYFMDKYGAPFDGNDISLKIIRSGRRNINNSVGAVSLLTNPLVYNPVVQNYTLVLDNNSKVISTSATECKQLWKSGATLTTCVPVCPTGGILSNDKTSCLIKQPVIITVDTIGNRYDTAKSFEPKPPYFNYSQNGTTIYSSYLDTLSTPNYPVNPADTFWVHGIGAGPLNRCGVWTSSSQYPYTKGQANDDDYNPCQQWVGYSEDEYFPYTGVYYIGMAGDNGVRVSVDDKLFRQDLTNEEDIGQFTKWRIYPDTITAGVHTVHVEGYNFSGPALFGVEIYGNTRQEIAKATSYDSLNILFSTYGGVGDLIPQPVTQAHYSCPQGYDLDSTGGIYTCGTHISPILTINSQVAGISGNWRPYKNYTYFGNRAQADPIQATDIRTDGTFKNFTPFWTYGNNGWQPSYDTTRWVWNSEMTLFNTKGFELENKDPLGRYTGGLYGYNNTLPTAVVQNARYSEVSFDGFEDYDYGSKPCDTVCLLNHSFGFSAARNKITAVEKHSGQYSLGLNPGDSVTISTLIQPYADSTQPGLTYTSALDNCQRPLLKTITADGHSALPQFSPLAGKKMVLSAWVKEGRDCKCTGYTANQISVGITQNNGTHFSAFTPSGAIIEGWQRYEIYLDIPTDATALYVIFKATDTAKVYFDDVRMHPFSANMKSFVYNPVNLRLMAELDENNYASFYEYDDDGTLVRVKKETQRGIKTIKETRSALLKE